MTREELRELLAKATPGPWGTVGRHGTCNAGYMCLHLKGVEGTCAGKSTVK